MALHGRRFGDDLEIVHLPARLRRVEEVDFVVFLESLPLAFTLRGVRKDDHARTGFDGRIGAVFGNNGVGMRHVAAVFGYGIVVALLCQGRTLRCGGEGHDALAQAEEKIGHARRMQATAAVYSGCLRDERHIVAHVLLLHRGYCPAIGETVVDHPQVGVEPMLLYGGHIFPDIPQETGGALFPDGCVNEPSRTIISHVDVPGHDIRSFHVLCGINVLFRDLRVAARPVAMVRDLSEFLPSGIRSPPSPYRRTASSRPVSWYTAVRGRAV